MNDQRVKTDNPNALICEFMGYEKSRDIWEKDEYAYTMKLPSVFNKWVIPSHMLFAKSWDWLMPVIGKIWEKCDQYTATLFDFDSIERPLTQIDIKETYKAVVEFMKWYQKQKSS